MAAARKQEASAKRLTATRPQLARVLGVSERTVERLEAAKVLGPTAPPRRGRVSRFDLEVCVPAYIDHRVKPPEDGERPRDAYYRAQTALAELKIAQIRREVLPRCEVVEDGQAAMRAVVTGLRALAARLLQAGAIEEAAVSAVEEVVHEVLREMAAWRTRVELLAAVDDVEEPAA